MSDKENQKSKLNSLSPYIGSPIRASYVLHGGSNKDVLYTMVTSNAARCAVLSSSPVKEIDDGMCSVVVDHLNTDNVSRETVHKRMYDKLVSDES
jgi:hypothetical protein